MLQKNNILKIDRLSAAFIAQNGESCAATVATKKQQIGYIVIILLAILLLAYRWDIFIFLVSSILATFYLLSAFFRLVSAVVGHFFRYPNCEVENDDLPIYTVLLPMYKESNIATELTKRILNLDYPHDKLDIKILLEADDAETLQALQNLHLPTCFEIIVMEPLMPKTKPRACNYGLEAAKGEFCVIYDAEDRPEVDQLKKAVSMFRRDTKGEVACVQAKLNYHNSRQNLLTRLFTIEYTTHFDLLLPGMQIFNFPLPLGGTSNHFRTQVLKKIGGWDPFNVTEDCDLGIRIYEHNYKTLLLDSTTWEEANSALGNWLRQRSRWIKGFLQTHLVHYRSWPQSIKRLGFWGAWGGFLAVGGSGLMLLCNIVFAFLISLYILLLAIGVVNGAGITEQIISYDGVTANIGAWPLVYIGEQESLVYSTLSIVFATLSGALFLANFCFIFIGILGCFKRRYMHLIAYTPLLIFYWLLMSVSAWKGLGQLFYKPFYWEKTQHGLNHKNTKI